MKEIFAEKRLRAKRNGVFVETRIIMMKPVASDKIRSCNVIFCDDTKYNAKINGDDDFNAIECAISYINTIFRNSYDPEYYWDSGESMRNIEN